MPEQGSNRTQPVRFFSLELADGAIPGYSGFRKFGFNSSMSDSYGACWPLDSSIPAYVFPQAAATLDVSSTSANDSGTAGTHARTVLIQGLDSVFAEQNEAVTLTGTSSVTTTSSFIRVNRAVVTSVGAYGNTNQGAITITSNSSGESMAVIPSSQGITQQVIFTVPAGKTAYIEQVNLFPSAGKTGVDMRGFVRQNADVSDTSGTISPFLTIGSIFDADKPTLFDLSFPAALPAKTDFEMQVRNQGGASPAIKAAIAVSIYYKDD